MWRSATVVCLAMLSVHRDASDEIKRAKEIIKNSGAEASGYAESTLELYPIELRPKKWRWRNGV